MLIAFIWNYQDIYYGPGLIGHPVRASLDPNHPSICTRNAELLK